MNLSLLDPFAADFPEMIEECLDDGYATTCCFNRRGTILAIGCHDGRVVAYDFDTRSPARTLTGHVHPVTSVSLSRNGRRLVSSSTDCTIFVWNVIAGTMETSIKFETPVLLARIHPKDQNKCVACTLYGVPVLVDLATGEHRTLPVVASAATHNEKESAKSKYDTNMVAEFSRRGDYIYTGDNKGNIAIISSATLAIESTFRVPGGAAIKAIEMSANGRQFLVNSTDRVIRLDDTETNHLRGGFEDSVNRMHWKKCCFSSNGDYIIGGSAQKSQHNISIWDSSGHLVKILEGPKEGMMDLVWHPTRPIIVSCSTQGVVYIWATNYQENWSAFAPDFKELEENEEYIEREDEFDIVDDAEGELHKTKDVEEGEEVDIMTVDKIATFDSDDDDDDLFYLPTVPDRDP